MFLLYFLAGHAVTGLVMLMVCILLTWRWSELNWRTVRYCAEEGYLMLLYAPLIVFLSWTGRLDAMVEKWAASKIAAPVD